MFFSCRNRKPCPSLMKLLQNRDSLELVMELRISLVGWLVGFTYSCFIFYQELAPFRTVEGIFLWHLFSFYYELLCQLLPGECGCQIQVHYSYYLIFQDLDLVCVLVTQFALILIISQSVTVDWSPQSPSRGWESYINHLSFKRCIHSLTLKFKAVDS